MRSTSWFVLASVLPACGSDAGGGAESAPEGGTEAGTGGKSAAGQSGSGGRAAAGTGGAAAVGAAGGRNTGGVSAGGVTSAADASTGDATPSSGGSVSDGGPKRDAESEPEAGMGCTGSPAVVCVDVPGTPVAFLDGDGEVLANGTGPIEHLVPVGGMVLAFGAIGPALYLDVPAGTTLRPSVPDVPPAPTDVQDIRIDVPAPPNGGTVFSATGCLQSDATARQLVGTGEKVFQMTTACLEEGRAAVLVFSTANAFIYVDGIVLGAATAAPLTVALPAWTTVSNPTTFRLTSIPAGFEGRVTYRPRWGQGELSNTTYGLLIAGGTGTASIPSEPNIGKEWRRFIQLGEGAPASRTARTVSHASVGHPLPASDSTSVVVDLLPIAENVQIAGRTISWSYPSPGPAGADRSIVNVIGTGANGDALLRVVSAPSRTSIGVPASLPSEFADYSVDLIQSATVLLEDLEPATSYRDLLSSEVPLLQFPGNIGDAFGRQSSRSTTP